MKDILENNGYKFLAGVLFIWFSIHTNLPWLLVSVLPIIVAILWQISVQDQINGFPREIQIFKLKEIHKLKTNTWINVISNLTIIIGSVGISGYLLYNAF